MPIHQRSAAQLFGLLSVLCSRSSVAPCNQIGRRLLAASTGSGGYGDDGGEQSGSSSPAFLLEPGAAFTLTKRFSKEEVASWAALTGDSNPIHVDGTAAAAVGLTAPILPGMLLAALFPAIIGSNFPGAVYLSQTLKFKHYASVGDSYTATLTVDKSSGSRVGFETLCRNTGTGVVVVEGSALALIRQQQQEQSDG